MYPFEIQHTDLFKLRMDCFNAPGKRSLTMFNCEIIFYNAFRCACILAGIPIRHETEYLGGRMGNVYMVLALTPMNEITTVMKSPYLR